MRSTVLLQLRAALSAMQPATLLPAIREVLGAEAPPPPRLAIDVEVSSNGAEPLAAAPAEKRGFWGGMQQVGRSKPGVNNLAKSIPPGAGNMKAYSI